MARPVVAIILGVQVLAAAVAASAQERAYFVTYGSQLEKQRELEISVLSTIGQPKDDSARYVAPWIEVEYGITRRWTAELYIEGVSIHDDGSAFTGWRLENRFRPFDSDRLFNPVFYIEYESVNEASRIQKEIVGEGVFPSDPVRSLAHDHAHELEGRLILSRHLRDWEVAGNLIVEKNLSENEGVEFGYTTGVSTRLRQFIAGVEMYGGLGASVAGGEETRHFLAPVFAWRLSRGSTIKTSVGFGLTHASERYLLRVGYSVDLW